MGFGRSLAGNAIRTALMRFTRSPLTGTITGAGSTAILQSSSGTTITGWMVALLGFKLKLGALMLPVMFFGAIQKIFARGRQSLQGNNR